jgi:lysophospholipase L1-like esterase
MLKSLNIFLAAAVIVAAVFFNSCSNSSTGPVDANQPLPALSITWTASNSIVCFGTSLTYGYRYYNSLVIRPPAKSPAGNNDTPPPYLKNYLDRLSSLSFTVDSSYPSYLAEQLKIRVENQGYVGAKTDRAIQLVNDSVLSKNPAVVLLEFGANDFIQGIVADSAEAHLNQLVTIIQNHGSKVILISFMHPDMVNHITDTSVLAPHKDLALAYYAMLKRVAQRFSIEIVEYPLQGIFGYPAYMSDFIHPNGLGYKKMEENISQALSLTFRANGMYK